MKNKVCEVAKSEIGYTERGETNETKFGKWFGLDGVAWCGIFVSWCYAQAGMPLPVIGFKKGFAGCQYAVQYFRKNNLIVDDPEPGDIVFFDWNNDGRFDHTGIFVSKKDDKSFITIEGNTSLKNQSNGGAVMMRTRNYKNKILFARV